MAETLQVRTGYDSFIRLLFLTAFSYLFIYGGLRDCYLWHTISFLLIIILTIIQFFTNLGLYCISCCSKHMSNTALCYRILSISTQLILAIWHFLSFISPKNDCAFEWPFLFLVMICWMIWAIFDTSAFLLKVYNILTVDNGKYDDSKYYNYEQLTESEY